MSRWPLLAVVAALAMLAGAAQAFTVTNRDANAQRLQITEPEGEGAEEFTIEPDETLDEVCETGCTIILENGVKETFEGMETVYIEDGSFVLVE